MIPTTTLARVLRQQERAHPHATGELTDLIVAIALGVKIISQIVATAGFKGLTGYSGRTNIQGEETQLLDEEADSVLVDVLGSSGHFGLLVSEERDSVVATGPDSSGAKYVVAFDPLDGSTNIGSNIPVGTIFCIWRKPEIERPSSANDFFQPGREIVASGYSVYGAKTSFVYSIGNGVFDFTLDPSIGEFILTEERLRTPSKGSIFSANEGNVSQWGKPIQDFLSFLKSENTQYQVPYTGRYVGSLVADFDRTLRRGGIFLYPGNKKHPNGKLRLLYECIPLSFIMEQAGGIALTGTERVLDIVPTDIHQRCGLIVGGTTEMDWYQRWMRAEPLVT